MSDIFVRKGLGKCVDVPGNVTDDTEDQYKACYCDNVDNCNVCDETGDTSACAKDAEESQCNHYYGFCKVPLLKSQKVLNSPELI